MGLDQAEYFYSHISFAWPASWPKNGLVNPRALAAMDIEGDVSQHLVDEMDTEHHEDEEQCPLCNCTSRTPHPFKAGEYIKFIRGRDEFCHVGHCLCHGELPWREPCQNQWKRFPRYVLNIWYPNSFVPLRESAVSLNNIPKLIVVVDALTGRKPLVTDEVMALRF